MVSWRSQTNRRGIIPVAIALCLSIFLLVSCGSVSEVDKYINDIDSILIPWEDAVLEYNEVIKEHNQMNLATLTWQEYQRMIQEELSGATEMYTRSSEAYHDLSAIIPPEELEEAHLLLIKSLGLSTTAYLEYKGFLEPALKTGKPDESIRRKANELMMEANELHLQATYEMNKYR